MTSFKHQDREDVRFIRLESVAHVDYRTGRTTVAVYFTEGHKMILRNDNAADAAALAEEIGSKL